MSRDLLVNSETGERSLGGRQSSPLRAVINATMKNLVRLSEGERATDAPSNSEGRSPSSEAAHRLQLLPQWVHLLPAILLIALVTILAHQPVRFGLLTREIKPWETVSFWQTWMTFVPMMLTIQFHSCMQVAKELWTQLDRSGDVRSPNQKDELVKKSRACSWAVDGLHAVLIIAYWLTLRLFQSNYFWLAKNTVGYVLSAVSLVYVCLSSTLFVNMRATFFDYGMLNEQFKQIRARSFWLILIQLALGMYVAVKATGMFPFTKELIQSLSERPDDPPGACGDGVTFNASYFDRYCDYKWERLSSGIDGLNRVCDDGGWKDSYRSRYDACRASTSVFNFYVDAYSALGISMNFYLWHVFLTVAHIRERDFRMNTPKPRTLRSHIQYGAVGVGLVVSTLSAMLYFGSILAVRNTGPVAEFIYDQYVDLVNIGAWLITYFFINLELIEKKAAGLYHKVAHKVVHAASAGEEWDVFLSHAWSPDGLGRDNHGRVRKINEELQERRIKTWFDEANMSGSTDHAMTEGIDSSKVVLVFITEAYINKVNNKQDNNNVGVEFAYTMQRKNLAQVKTICMEPNCIDPRSWSGPVGARLGGELYDDFSFNFEEEPEKFQAAITKLEQSIIDKSRSFQWQQVGLESVKNTIKRLTPSMTLSTKSRKNSHVSTELGRPGRADVEIGVTNSAAAAAEIRRPGSKSGEMGATSHAAGNHHLERSCKVAFEDTHM